MTEREVIVRKILQEILKHHEQMVSGTGKRMILSIEVAKLNALDEKIKAFLRED